MALYLHTAGNPVKQQKRLFDSLKDIQVVWRKMDMVDSCFGAYDVLH